MPTGKRLIQTTSVVPARVRLFQPTQRPKKRAGEWIETSWGRCKVDGRLGQRHADLLEAIQYCAERALEEEGGTIRLLVDPAKIRRMMSDDGYSEEQLWTLLKEMRSCTIEIDTQAIRLMGGVIESAARAKHTTVRNPFATRFRAHASPRAAGEARKRHARRGGALVATASERRLWVIRLGIGWTRLMKLDLPLHYDPAPLARLQHGISQAITRHILTHRAAPRGGWSVDSLIRAVAGELGGQALRDARRRLHGDTERLAALGIAVTGDRVHRTRPPGGVAQPPGGVALLQDSQDLPGS